MKVKNILKSHIFLLFFSILGSFLLLVVILSLVDMATKYLIMDFGNFLNVVLDPIVIRSIFLTFYASFLSTFITFILGVPLAYVLAKYNFKGKVVIESILNLPLMIPHSVAGILIYALFMRRGVIGAPLLEFGIVFEDNLLGIVIAMLFVSMPIFVNSVVEGFKSIDPHFERVAFSLGANERQVFTSIMFPLARRHLVSGSVMCWARGISEFGAVILIAYYPMIAPVLVYFRFNTQGLSGSGPIALLLIIICLIIFIIMYIYQEYSKSLVFGEDT